MATRLQRARPGWFTRLAAEIYLGAVVVGAVIVAVTGVVVVATIAMQVNAWVMAVD